MGKTIITIDDSATLRMSVELTLGAAGYNVVHAENGQEGLELLMEMQAAGHIPDMIIVDVNMPVMDGITFIREIKKTALKYLPILVLTTEREDSMKLKGKQAGASGWLLKPFNPDTLLAVVRKFTRSVA